MSNPYMTGEKYCEVYDEPRHQFHLRNQYVNVYEIQLPPGEATYFHRHCEDTAYFVIADADVEELFQDKPSIQTVAPCGGTLNRAHRDEPLIHQVKNTGGATMHMIGAEALARPDLRSTQALAAGSHTVSWNSKRFRVYEVETQSPADVVSYDVFGLLVSLNATTLEVIKTQGAEAATTRLLAGGFIWLDPPVTINFNETFRGIFIEWI